ncbi:MAG: response regulator [Spirochaetales bacterium]|nr:MAG: response regulator [Spirochaetales bacterium]
MDEKRKILIVDDTPANLKTLAAILKQDYQIIIAKSGEEALEILSSQALPHLVLLDVVMPGLDGYDVCTRLKSSRKTKEIPVIFLTGRTDAEDKKKGLDMGAAAFITKPFDALTVTQIVKTHIWLNRGY